MGDQKQNSEKLFRRKSDLPFLGNTTQDFNNKVYSLDFKVNLSQITFEGLNNYAVVISCLDKGTGITEKISTVLNIRLREERNSVSIDGSPFVYFSIGSSTLDLSIMDIEQEIVVAIQSCLDWIQNEDGTALIKNRREIPKYLLDDRIAINLLMSAVSTIIAGASACHQQTIRDKQSLFTNKSDYIDAMYTSLQQSMDDLTVVAINRGVHYYVNTT